MSLLARCYRRESYQSVVAVLSISVCSILHDVPLGEVAAVGVPRSALERTLRERLLVGQHVRLAHEHCVGRRCLALARRGLRCDEIPDELLLVVLHRELLAVRVGGDNGAAQRAAVEVAEVVLQARLVDAAAVGANGRRRPRERYLAFVGSRELDVRNSRRRVVANVRREEKRLALSVLVGSNDSVFVRAGVGRSVLHRQFCAGRYVLEGLHEAVVRSVLHDNRSEILGERAALHVLRRSAEHDVYALLCSNALRCSLCGASRDVYRTDLCDAQVVDGYVAGVVVRAARVDADVRQSAVFGHEL